MAAPEGTFCQAVFNFALTAPQNRKYQTRTTHTTAMPPQNHQVFQTGRASVKLYQPRSSASLPMNHSVKAFVMTDPFS